MSKELTAAVTVLANNGIECENMTESQIITIANAMASSAQSAQLETLDKALKDGRKALNDKVSDLKLTPVQKAIKAAKKNAADQLDSLTAQVDAIRQAQAAESGAKLGNKIADLTTTVDKKLTEVVPGVSNVKGFLRGITGAFKS